MMRRQHHNILWLFVSSPILEMIPVEPITKLKEFEAAKAAVSMLQAFENWGLAGSPKRTGNSLPTRQFHCGDWKKPDAIFGLACG